MRGGKVARRLTDWAKGESDKVRPMVVRMRQKTGRQRTTDRAVSLCHRVIAKTPDPFAVKNCQIRLEVLEKCDRDGAMVETELAKCKADFLYWLEHYAWTFNPRIKIGPKDIPFIPFEVQREFAAYVKGVREADREGIVEKSRDQGATWMFVAWFVWSWLFEEGFTGLFASRKVTLVDSKGDLSSIMEKARFVIKNLPAWMVPAGWDERRHSIKLKIINPANGSILTGEGGNQIGRGGRASVVLIDEAAYLPNQDAADSALSATSEVKFWLSTPHKPGDQFAQKRFSGDYPVFTFHWLRNPLQNEWVAVDANGEEVARGRGKIHGDTPGIRVTYPWYEKEKKKLVDPVKIAREIDIDYQAASDAVVYPAAWVMACVDFEAPMGSTIVSAMDMAGGGANSNVLTHRSGPVVLMQTKIVRRNPTLVARAALSQCRTIGTEDLHYDHGGGYGGALLGEYESGGAVWPFGLSAVISNDKATNRRFYDPEEGPRARELFKNLRAELHWTIRERMRKTYELALFRAGDPDGVEHPVEECISIPNDRELIDQLTTILYDEVAGGQIILESKAKMRERNIPSPDKADSLAMTEAPKRHMALTPGTVIAGGGGAN